jgi:hypothetical protein
MPFAIFSTACSADRMRWRLAAVFLLASSSLAWAEEGSRIAVFPPVDRTGRAAPAEQVQATLELSLTARGFDPVPRAELEEFFRRHRIRHMGGVTAETAIALRAETHADGVLLSSIDDWEMVDPPRFALTARWVAATPEAALAWMETSAQHGHERPGAFGLGLVGSIDFLMYRASEDIAESLSVFARSSGPARADRAPGRFRPGSFEVDPDWAAATAAGPPLRVAVLPFVVDGARRDVGEVVASQFVRWIITRTGMIVLEPGIVRAALLEARVIQEDGPSLPQLDALHALLDVDLVISGRVTDHEAMGSSPGTPFLGFSARALDATTRQAVWSSFSFGRGDDRVGLFGTSRISSSITLTSGLVRGAVEALQAELESRRPRKGAAEGKGKNR